MFRYTCLTIAKFKTGVSEEAFDDFVAWEFFMWKGHESVMKSFGSAMFKVRLLIELYKLIVPLLNVN